MATSWLLKRQVASLYLGRVASPIRFDIGRVVIGSKAWSV